MLCYFLINSTVNTPHTEQLFACFLDRALVLVPGAGFVVDARDGAIDKDGQVDVLALDRLDACRQCIAGAKEAPG